MSKKRFRLEYYAFEKKAFGGYQYSVSITAMNVKQAQQKLQENGYKGKFLIVPKDNIIDLL